MSPNPGTRYATASSILAAFAFFRANPGGKLWIDWCTAWNEREFREWFRTCLNRRISAADTRPVPGGTRTEEEFQDLQLDARVINDRARRIVRRGRNILRSPGLKAAYPEIDHCMSEDAPEPRFRTQKGSEIEISTVSDAQGVTSQVRL